MTRMMICIVAVILTGLGSGIANADESDSSGKYHPFMTDTFNLGLGFFRPSKDVNFRIDGTPGEPIDISEDIEMSDTESTGSLNFRWRYTKNWSLWGQYWSTKSSETATLTNDVTLGDPPVTINAGATVKAGVESSILRVFFGRSFSSSPQSEWGLGAGLHWMELTASLQLKADVTPPSDINIDESRTVGGGVPLPNFGAWYMYSWSPKWVALGRIDWLSVDVGEYSGALHNFSAGVNYQMSKHFGIGLAVNAFNLRAEVNRDGFSGEIESNQVGPRINLTANW
jgi:hypothetical protein